MAAPARAAAFRALRTLSTTRTALGEALARTRDLLGDPRDRALTTELTTGTLRWQGALDYQLQLRSARALATLDAAVLDALRLGAYQLLHLERIPSSAVVNDSVSLVKSAGLTSASGFVNAILRRLARERGALTWPSPADVVEHLAVVHSHPAWLVARWLERYGAATTERWLRFNNAVPALSLATNRLRGTRDTLRDTLAREQVETIPTAIAPYGLTVVTGHPLTTAAFLEGDCVVQDEASQIIPELLEAQPGERLLDACASPGGKTLAMAAACGPHGRVVATDTRWRRITLLAATIARCRAPNVHVAQIGATTPLPFHDGSFRRVLVDAPCSGLGTVRRDPDIRWRREPDDLAVLARRQVDLLRRIAPVVGPGGSIVYSTCSSEPEENEEVVAAFLAEADDFALRPLGDTGLPASIRAMATAEGCLRTSPVHGLEAFFGAVLQRKDVG